jgi:raffinose/stachyose/melibiose transport system substrate-binding protein
MKMKKVAAFTAIALSTMASAAIAQTELEVASWKGAGTEVANFPAIIERFEQAHPDIKVKLNYMARNDMVTTIPARFQAGTPPDVLMVDREFVTHWGGNGQLMDLSGEEFISRIQPALRPHLGLGDNTYYAMLQISGMGVYVNDDLMKQAGITAYPETLSEFTATCGKLREQGTLPLLLAGNNGNWTPYVFFLALALADGDVPSQDRLAKFNSGELKFVDDAAVKGAFEAFRTLIDAKCFDPKISAGTDPWSVGLTTFQSGRVAMLPQGLWNITPFAKDALPENFSLHPFPSANGTQGITMDYLGPGWAIPAAAKDKEAAKKWIDFWIQDENLKLFLEADTALTTLEGGTSGLPMDIASNYVESRNENRYVTFPVGALPIELTDDMMNAVTSFMLDPSQDYNKILQRWDSIVEKDIARR